MCELSHKVRTLTCLSFSGILIVIARFEVTRKYSTYLDSEDKYNAHYSEHQLNFSTFPLKFLYVRRHLSLTHC